LICTVHHSRLLSSTSKFYTKSHVC
jgi:hypothetical protein